MKCDSFSEQFLSSFESASEDDCFDCLREIVEKVPEYLRAAVTRPFFDEEPQVLKMLLAMAAAASQDTCRHAGTMALIDPKSAKCFSAAIRKTPIQYHELLFSMVHGSSDTNSFVKAHRSHFLEETSSLGFVRAFFSLLDFWQETDIEEKISSKSQTAEGSREVQDYIDLFVSVLAESSRTNMLISAAKWLPTFIVGTSEKLKVIAMLQGHSDPHVKCIGIFHAISMSQNNQLKSKYKIPSKTMWRALLDPKLDIEARVDMDGFHGSIARVALRIISGEIETTEEKIELCETISEKWRQQTVSTKSTNKELVEKSLARLYLASGAPPPQKVVWFKSPVAAAREAEKYSKMLSCDSSKITTAASWGSYFLPYKQWSTIEAYYVRLEWLISELGKPRNFSNVWRWQESRSSANDIYTFVAGVNDWLRSDRNDQFLLRIMSKQRLGTIGYRSFLHHLDLCFEPNDGLEEILLNCGGFFAFERVAFVVERPSKLHRDNGRIHCATGKAIEYSDGWGSYVWKNISVPEELILSPQTLSKKRIDSEHNPDLKWAMIDIYGTRRYMEESDLDPIDESEFGSLYHLKADNRPHLAILRVHDATPNSDGSRKEYFMSVPVVQTAKEAVAWTFSIGTSEYSPTVET